MHIWNYELEFARTQDVKLIGYKIVRLLLTVQCKTKQYLLLLSIISDVASNNDWLIPFWSHSYYVFRN